MANLERCLVAAAGHIAAWVIGDTGSTDGTPAFIEAFFAKRGIPGELHRFPFRNFEQARNEALDRAYASPLGYDYLLFAEQILQKNSYVGTCGRYQLHGTQIHAHA